MHRTALDTLLYELKEEVAQHLPPATINSLSQTTTQWRGFFTSNEALWKKLIARDFGIQIETLARFADYANAIIPTIAISFAKIYQRLHVFHKAGYPLQSPEYHLTLLACCVNHQGAEIFLKKLVPVDEAHVWSIASIKMHANQVAKLLIKLFPHVLERHILNELIESTVASANTEMLEHLQKYLSKPEFIINYTVRIVADHHPYLEKLFYWFEQFPQYARKIRGFLMFAMACCRSLTLYEKFVEHCDKQFGEFDKFEDGSNPLSAAVASSDEKIFSYLLKKYPKLLKQSKEYWFLNSNIISNKEIYLLICKLDPDFFTDNRRKLLKVANSGNLEAIRFVLEHYEINPNSMLYELSVYSIASQEIGKSKEALLYLIETYQLKPDRLLLQQLLNVSAADESLFRYLMSKFNLRPTREALAYAIKGGNIALFEELRLTYELEPTRQALRFAITSGIIDIIPRLMNEFGKEPYPGTCGDASRASIPVARTFLLQILGEDIILRESKLLNQNLINSHRQIFQGLQNCASRSFNEAAGYWMEAAKLSIRHFFAFVTRAMCNPQQYHLDEKAIGVLRTVAYEATSSVDITIPEREEIYSMLINSDDIELQVLATAFTLENAFPALRV